MKILIIESGNTCRSRMAEGFLLGFDPNLVVCSVAIGDVEDFSEPAVAVMSEVGVNIGGDPMVTVDRYLSESWDYVITICSGDQQNWPVFTGKVRNWLHLKFDDPLRSDGSADFVTEEFRRVRDAIKETFYDLYRNTLLSGSGQCCPCGANTFCRCE